MIPWSVCVKRTDMVLSVSIQEMILVRPPSIAMVTGSALTYIMEKCATTAPVIQAMSLHQIARNLTPPSRNVSISHVVIMVHAVGTSPRMTASVLQVRDYWASWNNVLLFGLQATWARTARSLLMYATMPV